MNRNLYQFRGIGISVKSVLNLSFESLLIFVILIPQKQFYNINQDGQSSAHFEVRWYHKNGGFVKEKIGWKKYFVLKKKKVVFESLEKGLKMQQPWTWSSHPFNGPWQKKISTKSSKAATLSFRAVESP